MAITLNPNATTNISSGFLLQTEGYVQGFAQDDPAMRYQWEGAQVGGSTVLWGGLAVQVNLQGVDSNMLGPVIIPSTSAATINAITIFNQSMNGIITPSSNVPQYAVGSSLNIVRFGSLARVCVAVESTAILNGLADAEANVALYWDTTNLCITTTSGGNYALPSTVKLITVSANGKTVYATGGNANWSVSGGSGTAGCCAIIEI
jgi:hypothetical protein